MKIVLLTTEYHTEHYRAAGISRAFGKIAHWLADHGHEVLVVTLGRDDKEYDERPGIRVRRFVPRHHFHWRLRAAATAMASENFRRLIHHDEAALTAAELIESLHREGRCDAALTSADLCGPLISRGRVPVVLRLQHPWHLCLRAEFRRPTLATHIGRWRERRAARRATRVYVPSRLGASNYAGIRAEEIPVIRTPMFPLHEPLPWADVKARHNLPDDFLIFFGGLLGTKGAHVLAEALPKFFAQNAALPAVLCGRVSNAPDGSQMDDYIRRHAGEQANRISILPALEHDELFALVKQCRFVVLPSVLDNLPNALMEAMYFGKLVVGSRGASMDEIIEDGTDGLLATPGDAGDLARVMLRAAQLPAETARAIGDRAAKKCRELFNPDTVVQQVVDLLAEAAREHGSFQ